MADNLTPKMEKLAVVVDQSQEKAKTTATGMAPLPGKMRAAVNAPSVPVQLTCNIQKLTLNKNQPIFKYDVSIIIISRRQDGSEGKFEISKSSKSRPEHEQDKIICHRVYQRARDSSELKNGGPYYYDRQASLYSLSRIPDEVKFTATGADICPRDSFIRAEFTLKKVQESFQTTSNDIPRTVNVRPALTDRTLHEALSLIISAPAIENNNVLTINNSVHYLYSNAPVSVQTIEGTGGKSTAVGAKKSVKTLEGHNGVPTLYMTTELKTTFFHPDNATLLDVLMDYQGFNGNLQPNSNFVLNNRHSFIGLKLYRNYGKNANIGEDGSVLRIRGFGLPANQQTFLLNGVPTTVEKYFFNKFNITLNYPNLFTIEAKGKFSNSEFLPVELLNVVNSQVVTTEQMTPKEQEALVKLSANKPHIRKSTTEEVVRSVGIASNTTRNFITVSQPETFQGLKLPKPTIVFKNGKQVIWDENKKGAVTDFMAAGQFYEPAKLTNWEVVFNEGEEFRDAIPHLTSTMSAFGMLVEQPAVSFISRGNLRSIFQNAQSKKRQLIVMITKARYNYHTQMKALEQEFQVLTQEIKYETALKLAQQPNTKKNIVNKINVKLGGLNYFIGTQGFQDGTLVVGFETSQRGGCGDFPISIGYAANMGNHFQKFQGGYVYAKRSQDLYGAILKETMTNIINTYVTNRGKEPNKIVIYFNGVTEGQYAIINEIYSQIIKDVCTAKSKTLRPAITLMASSKTHNERFYKVEQRGVSNVDPCTVIDKVVVSPVLNEFYLASAVARQGTVKTTKYTVVFTTSTNDPLYTLERLTNDLCFLHEIIFHPVGLPAPLYIAGSSSERGAKILAHHRPSTDANGEYNLEEINQKLGYNGKTLHATRFNA